MSVQWIEFHGVIHDAKSRVNVDRIFQCWTRRPSSGVWCRLYMWLQTAAMITQSNWCSWVPKNVTHKKAPRLLLVSFDVAWRPQGKR